MKIDAEHRRRFDQALLDETPFNRLFDLAVSLRDEGVSQLDIYMLFEHFLQQSQSEDARYDWITEVMDFIWCYPPYTSEAGLFPTALTNGVVEEYGKGISCWRF